MGVLVKEIVGATGAIPVFDMLSSIAAKHDGVVIRYDEDDGPHSPAYVAARLPDFQGIVGPVFRASIEWAPSDCRTAWAVVAEAAVNRLTAYVTFGAAGRDVLLQIVHRDDGTVLRVAPSDLEHASAAIAAVAEVYLGAIVELDGETYVGMGGCTVHADDFKLVIAGEDMLSVFLGLAEQAGAQPSIYIDVDVEHLAGLSAAISPGHGFEIAFRAPL